MKLSYFEDTDTLYIEFKQAEISESKDLDENTILELDKNNDIIALTVEHASSRTDIQNLTLNGIAA